jgi:predicted esterase
MNIKTAIISIMAIAAFGASPAHAQDMPRDGVQVITLESLVEQYFRTTGARARKELAQKIEDYPGATVNSVREIIRTTNLWESREPGPETFTLKTEAGETDVTVVIPQGYDAAKAYPLIIALHGQGGEGGPYAEFVRWLLGPKKEQWIVAGPSNYSGWSFSVLPKDQADPARLIRELKHRYHVDDDRVYVTGYSMGGHGSMAGGVLFTDYFAGAAPLAGAFDVPFREQLYPMLIENVRTLPVLHVWGENDGPFKNVPDSIGINFLGRQLRDTVRSMNLSEFQSIELENTGHRDVRPPREPWFRVLSQKRNHWQKRIQHRFRYESRGRIGWLRVSRMAGPSWVGRLTVMVPQDGSVDDYIHKTLDRKLGYIRGDVIGRRIEIQTNKVDQLEVLLDETLVDFDQPVEIIVDEKTRYSGKVNPSIPTMLDIAYNDWDFSRLPAVRFTIAKRGPARQN